MTDRMIGRTTRRAMLGVVLLAGMFAAACVAPATQQHTQAGYESAPCADSLYSSLGRQNPDSLSEREWTRLRSLERECTISQHRSHNDGRGGMMSHGGSFGMGIVAVLMMVAMMAF